MSSPVMAFADYMKDFLLEMDASQKQADGHFQLVVYGSYALTAHKKNYHSTNWSFWH